MPQLNTPQEDLRVQAPPQLSLKERDPELFNLLRAIPTRAEIDGQLNNRLDSYALRMEAVVKEELKPVHEALSGISSKIASLEEAQESTVKRVSLLETSSKDTQSQVLNLALQVVDLEDRNRRNNIRVRGVPDSVKPSELETTVREIFNYYLHQDSDTPIELDRVHRVLGPRGPNGSRSRDILCRVHRYKVKEAIMQAAWDAGGYEMGEAKIILLQDLSNKTLKMRRTLKPLLEAATEQGASYRWGYPFRVTFKHRGRALTLRSHSQLQDICEFLGTPLIDIPDWRNIAVE